MDRSSKPTSLLSTKSGGLRGVVVPEELMSKFMALAESNTLRNVETCGVLAGRLVSTRYRFFFSFFRAMNCNKLSFLSLANIQILFGMTDIEEPKLIFLPFFSRPRTSLL